MKIDRYIFNNDLPIINRNWRGNPVTSKSRFLNHEFPFIPKFSDILKWRLREGSKKEEKSRDNFRLDVSFPKEYFFDHLDGLVWLGHASFLLRLGGKNILIDPILFSPTPFMPRYVQFPFDYSLLKDLDLILISHDHRDHLDEKSLRSICSLNPNTPIYTGINMKPLISSWVNNYILEAGWWQSYPQIGDLKISFLPTRHWSKRNIRDTNSRLWGSFLMEFNGKKIFFGADSGFGSHYREINSFFGEMDLAILGIGAYKPEWFMHPSHTSPQDALRAAVDLKAGKMVPMHYGTFDLSDETIGEPIRVLRDTYINGNYSLDLKIINPGEFLTLA